MLPEHLLGHPIGRVNEFAGLAVNLLGRLLRVGLREGHIALAGRIVERTVAHLVAHAVVGHHGVGLFGHTLQVVQRAGRDLTKGQLLRHTTTQRGSHLVHELLARRDLTLLGQIPGSTQRLATRDDRHLDERRGMLQQPAHRGMTRLVVGNLALLGSRDDLILTLQAANDAVDSGQEILLGNEFLIVAGSDQCRLVADVGNIGTRESGGLTSQEGTVECRVELERAQMHLEDLLALLDIGQAHLDLTIEASGTHQRLIQNIGSVRSRQDDHAGIGLEAVHLRKQLVERIFTFVVARESGILATGTTDGVDLVDKDNAGGLLLGLLKEVAHTRCTHTDKHLDKVRTRDREERHIGLTRHRLGQQRLTRSRRAY